MANKSTKDEVELGASPAVISIDPGGTSGWSILQVHPVALLDTEFPILTNIECWQNGQFTGNENQQAKDVLDLIDAWPGCAVVMEGFILRKFSSDDELLSPVRLIAKIEYGLWLLGMTYFPQQPSEAKSVATDDRLKNWGLYKSEGGMQHARDADRHGITFLRKCKQKAGLRGYAWPHLYGEGAEFGPDLPVAEQPVQQPEAAVGGFGYDPDAMAAIG
jgi:hypothetical protein